MLGTDGLWDVMSNAEVADFLQRYRHCRDADVSCAEALTLEAQERWKAMHEEVRRGYKAVGGGGARSSVQAGG